MSLDPDGPDTIRLPVEDAENLASRALARIGLSPAEVACVAPHLVDAGLCGYASAGLARIPAIARTLEPDKARLPPRIERETPVSALIDGGHSLGYVAVLRATDIAAEKAALSGLAAVAVHNAWNSGRAGFYVERLARAGLVAIHTTSTPPLVVPPGAARRGLGTNPIAIGVPGHPDPLVVDLGTGAVAWAEVSSRAERGESFEAKIGIDADGAPTASARDILAGGLQPFGGHKGFALSLAIQALGLVAGSRRRAGNPADFGYLIIAFRPDLFGSRVELDKDLRDLIAAITALPLRPGADPVRIPSEKAFREREIRRREGLVVPRDLHRRLVELAAGGGPL